MIQDISPAVLHNQYIPIPPADEDYIMIVRNGSLLVRRTEYGIDFPRFRDTGMRRSVYLFSVDSVRFYLYRESDMDTQIAELQTVGCEFLTMRELRVQSPIQNVYAGTVACQLAEWYESHRFCGHCGTLMQHAKNERMVYCPNCRQTVYPKICPAVIVAVLHEDKILLTKYAGAANAKRYALIAGFAEIGETIEQTAAREVFEETGVHIKNLRFYKSQPWPFSSSLLMGFFCELDGTPDITMQSDELSVAEWVDQRDTAADSDGISLTSEMIALYHKYGRQVLSEDFQNTEAGD